MSLSWTRIIFCHFSLNFIPFMKIVQLLTNIFEESLLFFLCWLSKVNETIHFRVTGPCFGDPPQRKNKHGIENMP